MYILLFGLLVACGAKDPKLKAIEDNIISNAMGVEIDYKPISTETVAVVTMGQTIEDYKVSLQLEENKSSFEEFLELQDRVMDRYKKEGNSHLYHFCKFRKERIESLINKDYALIDYEILKHTYSIVNPVLNDAKVNVVNYYFFDGEGALMFRVSEGDMKRYKYENISTDLAPYEAAIYQEMYL